MTLEDFREMTADLDGDTEMYIFANDTLFPICIEDSAVLDLTNDNHELTVISLTACDHKEGGKYILGMSDIMLN
jgi:hypothetical protein